MTRKQTRTAKILVSLAVLGFAVFLFLTVIRDTLVYFYTPSELIEKGVKPGTPIRLGGMVENGTWQRLPDSKHVFVATDTLKSITMSYTGVLPDLFREGQGVVAEGVLQADGSFLAVTVLAKHDENYMPRELMDSLNKKGVQLGKSATP